MSDLEKHTVEDLEARRARFCEKSLLGNRFFTYMPLVSVVKQTGYITSTLLAQHFYTASTSDWKYCTVFAGFYTLYWLPAVFTVLVNRHSLWNRCKQYYNDCNELQGPWNLRRIVCTTIGVTGMVWSVVFFLFIFPPTFGVSHTDELLGNLLLSTASLSACLAYIAYKPNQNLGEIAQLRRKVLAGLVGWVAFMCLAIFTGQYVFNLLGDWLEPIMVRVYGEK